MAIPHTQRRREDDADPDRVFAVVILSTCRLTRDGLAQLLASVDGVKVIACAPSAADARGHLENGLDAVLIDVNTLGASELRSMPDATVPQAVAFGLHSDDGAALARWIAAGVRVCLSSDATVTQLIDGIHAAVRGDVLCPPLIADLLVREPTPLALPTSPSRTHSALTAREAGILELVSLGLSNKEIASKLEITLSTVKNHIHSILTKLHARRRRDAVALAEHTRPDGSDVAVTT